MPLEENLHEVGHGVQMKREEEYACIYIPTILLVSICFLLAVIQSMCSCFAHATWEWELASIIISLLDCSRSSTKQIWTTGHSCEPALKYQFSSMQGFSGHVTIYIEIQISLKLYSWHPIAGWRIKIQSITIDQSTIVYITVGVALRIRPRTISLFTIYVSPRNWPQLDRAVETIFRPSA